MATLLVFGKHKHEVLENTPESYIRWLATHKMVMKDVAVFDIDEIIPVEDGIVAVLSLVDDEDVDESDVFSPIGAVRCPDCDSMVRDFKHHRCFR